MASPFTIRDEIERILAQHCDPETGEITDETIGLLDALELDLRDRVLEYAAYAKGERAEAAKIAGLAHDLLQRAQRHERRAERLERAIAAGMTPGTQRFEDERAEVFWRKSQAVEIADESKLPEAWWREKVERAPDKVKIRDALKSGCMVDGAELVTRWNLQVK